MALGNCQSLLAVSSSAHTQGSKEALREENGPTSFQLDAMKKQREGRRHIKKRRRSRENIEMARMCI